jgi:hypothetical protein
VDLPNFGNHTVLREMVPLLMVAAVSSASIGRSQVLGATAVPHLVNSRALGATAIPPLVNKTSIGRSRVLGTTEIPYLPNDTSFERGQVLGTTAIPYLLNKRWRTVPVGENTETYEWVLRRESKVIGSPTTLDIYLDNGLHLSRTAYCPQFLANYIALESPNLKGCEEIFRDNTVYFLDATSCTMQNTWFTSPSENSVYGPYFLGAPLPMMRSVLVDAFTTSPL